MIRLIRRRLIIPRGDTGTFSIPMRAQMSESDVAIFSIFDPLTHKNLLEKKAEQSSNTLIFTFSQEDTVNLAPRRYLWDVTIYTDPVYDEDGILIDGAEINSYYAAFSLPVCEIREVTHNV